MFLRNKSISNNAEEQKLLDIAFQGRPAEHKELIDQRLYAGIQRIIATTGTPEIQDYLYEKTDDSLTLAILFQCGTEKLKWKIFHKELPKIYDYCELLFAFVAYGNEEMQLEIIRQDLGQFIFADLYEYGTERVKETILSPDQTQIFEDIKQYGSKELKDAIKLNPRIKKEVKKWIGIS